MKKLFLHIGTHKTGSTAIQHTLFRNRAALRRQDFYYPCEGRYYFGREKSQSFLAHALLGRRPNYLDQRALIDRDSCVAEFKRDVSASNCRNIVVSSEHFSYAKKAEDWRNVHDTMASLADNITVIVYLRRQDTMLESTWSQLVKTGLLVASFDDFRKEYVSPNHFTFLQALSDVFGRSSIVVRPYELAQLHERDVVADFFSQIGVELLGENGQPTVLNRTPSLRQLEAMRLINRQIGSVEQRKLVSRYLMLLNFGDKQIKYSYFASGERRQFLEPFRESNSLVAREFLGRIDGVLFRESEETGAPTFPGLTVGELASIAANALSRLATDNRMLVQELKRSKRIDVQ